MTQRKGLQEVRYVLMGKESRTPKIDRSRLRKPPRTGPATPGINTLGVGEYHEEDEEGKSFTLQRRLEHYWKHIDIYTKYGYTEEMVRSQPGLRPCFGCGGYHRKQDWVSRKGEKFRGISCAEVARMSEKKKNQT